MKPLTLGLLSIFLIVSTGVAQECINPKSEDCPHEPRFEMMRKFEMLDLTEEQREEIEDAEIGARKKIIPLKAEIELKMIDLENEMRADELNRTKIMKITEDISDLRLKIQQTKIDQRLKIHSILTPEQREQLQRPMHKTHERRLKFREE